MISKKTLLIATLVLPLSFAMQIMQASLWQTICSPFARATQYIKQRPLIVVASVLSVAAISGGAYWWYKKSSKKKNDIFVPKKSTTSIEKLDAGLLQKQQLLDQAIIKWNSAIKTFNSTKDLIKNHAAIEDSFFYTQLNVFLPQVRTSLRTVQQEEFDSLKFGQILEGSGEYWQACANLFFYLDEYIRDAQISLETVKRVRKECDQLS